MSEFNNLSPTISNLDKLLASALDNLTKLIAIWSSSNLDIKRRVQKALFPEGIFYDVKKHEYLTKKTNTFLYLTDYLSKQFSDEGKKNPAV